MKTTNLIRLWARLIALLSAVAISATAQTPSAPTTPPTSSTTSAPAATPAPAQPNFAEEVIVMQTFEVVTDKDIGYIAVDALAGGRSATPIKLTPSAMSSLTRTFIDDVGVTDIRDSLKWSLNVIASDADAGKTGSPFASWDYNFRGAGQSLQGGSGPTRNYFTFYQVADAYNIDRVEFDRGPNSILFGVGTIGGVLSIYTKQPRTDRDFLTAAATFDSNYAWRFEADANKRVTKKLTLRINALLEDDRGWLENDHNRQQAIDLALAFKFTDRTRLLLDLEASQSKITLIKSAFGEGATQWDGTTAPTAGTVLPTGTNGITKQQGWASGNYWVYQPGNTGAGLQNYITAYRTVGADIKYAPYAGFYKSTLFRPHNDPSNPDPYPTGIAPSRIPMMPSRDFTYGSGISDITYANLTASLEHQFTRNLDMTLSFYRYNDRNEARNYEWIGAWSVDINEQLPDGTPNPNFRKRYGDFYLTKQPQTRNVTEGRVQFNWQFEAAPVKQRFSLAAGIQEIKWGSDQLLALTAPQATADWRNDLVWARYYFDNPNAGINLPASISGKSLYYTNLAGIQDWSSFEETHDLANIALVSHTRVWDDHLSVIAGVRYDDYEYDQMTRNMHKHTTSAAHDTTYSIGGVYFIHGLSWLGVFGNYSRNFDPINPGQFLQLDGTPLGAAKGEGQDYGIRISTKDGKYYASASRYEGKSSGRATPEKIGISGLWRNYYKAQGLPENTDPARTSLEYSDTEALELSGYEFEVTANPLPSLRIMASLALPESTITDAMPGQRPYFAQNLPTWVSVVQPGRDSGNTERIAAANNLANDLIAAANMLNNNLAGKTQRKLVDYTANVFANYTFLRGPLKGFSAGAGATFVGKQYLKTIREREYYADTRYTTSLVLAYTTKIFGRETRLALNVDNFLNNDDAVITDYDDGWRYDNEQGAAIPNGYYLQSPIVYRLSAKITF